MVDRDACGSEHVAEDAQCFQPADAGVRDRGAGLRSELGGGTGMVERWGIEADPVERILDDRLRELLGGGVVCVHDPKCARGRTPVCDVSGARSW